MNCPSIFIPSIFIILRYWAILLLIIPLPVFAEDQAGILVRSAAIKHAEFFERYVTTGHCKVVNSRDYRAKVSGRVEQVALEQGKYVKAGTTLLIIDYNLANALKEEAEATLYTAESNYNRELSLMQKKIISKEEFNKAKAAMYNAKAALVKAINTYNDMVITAPFDGYIGVVRVEAGQEVRANDYLFSLVAKNSERVLFTELPSALLGRIKENSEFYIFDINHNKVPGKLMAVADYFSDKGTVSAKINIPALKELPHGSYLKVEIIYNKHSNLAIPAKAVLKNEQGDFVYKITPDNLVKKVYVNLGTTTGNMVELVSGDLKEDDLIVLDGLTKIYDNAVVKVITD